MRGYLLGLQDRIVAAIEAEDSQPFITDAWQREPGGTDETPKTPAASAPQGGAPALGRSGAGLSGEGRSRLLEGGAVIERGGCSFSHV
ncbi:MAG: hypothetical protein ABI781_15175, partial [Burkholderiales bacterium]